MGPNLRVAGVTDGLAETVHDGLPGGMPGFHGITSIQIQDLAAYFLSMGQAGEPIFTHWWEATPSQ